MEDILASIRRIIADDQQATGSRLGGRRAQPTNATGAPIETSLSVAPDREEILDLARFAPGGEDAHAEESGHEPSEEVASDAADTHVGFAPHVALPQSELPAHTAAPEHFASADAYGADEDSRELSLLASPMSESVMSAFEALAATVVLENKPMLEGILRDLLRPMLKAWLDDNLPGLVERLVRVEIERVARGGRG